MTTTDHEFTASLHGLPVLVTVRLHFPPLFTARKGRMPCVHEHEDWEIVEVWLLDEIDGQMHPWLDLMAAGFEPDCLADEVARWLNNNALEDAA